MGYKVVGTQNVTYRVNSKEEQDNAKKAAQKKSAPASSAQKKPDALINAMLAGVRPNEAPKNGINRTAKALSGAAKYTGAGYTNLGGTGIEGMGRLNTAIAKKQDAAQVNKLREDNSRYQQMLKTGKKLDGTALTQKERETFSKIISRNQQMMGIVQTYTKAQEERTKAAADEFYHTADKLSESAAQDVAEAKQGLGRIGQLAVDVGVAGTQMAGDIALGAMTGGSALPAMFLRSVGSSAQEARQSGASYGQQLAYGLGSGALSVATEKIANVAAPFRKAFGAGVADKAISKAVERLGGNALGKTALSMLSEGAEEFIEDVFQPVLQRATYDPQASFNLEDALYDAAIGAVLGGIGGGVDAVAAGHALNAAPAAAGTEAQTEQGSFIPGVQSGAESVLDANKAAPGVEAAEPVRVGRVTTIKSPYQGVTPVQTQKSASTVSVDSGSVRIAQNRIDGAHGLEKTMPGKSFKSTLKDAYKQIFKPSKNVPVHGLAYNGKQYTVDIGSKVLGKVISDPNLTAEKLALLDILPQIVQNGDYVGSGNYVRHGSKGTAAIRYDYFETPVEINGASHIAKFDVEVVPGANNYRTHQVIKMELTPAETSLVGPAPTASSETSIPVEGALPLNLDSTIPQGAENVNSSDGLGAADAGFDPFTAAQAEYGTLPSGENPVRSDDVPVSTDGTDRVSQTVVTAKGAAVTPDEFVPLLENATMKGQFSFIPISNSETVQRVIEKITRDGWPAARSDWTADVRAGKASEDLTAMGAILYNNSVNSGDTRAALDILTDYQALVRNTARGLQAARILKTLTPDNRLYMIRRSVQSMVDSMGLSDVVIDPALEQAYISAKSDAEADAVLDDIKQNIADQIPSTALDKWHALRYLNMLGNFKTQVRNFAGNVGMGEMASAKDAVAAAIERMAGTDRTKSVTVGRDLLAAAKNDFSTVQELAAGSGKYSRESVEGDALLRDIMDRRRIFKTDALEAYRKATDWAMNNDKFGDVSFLRRRYGRALAGYLKANGITAEQFMDPVWQKQNAAALDKARTYAIREAQEATFRDDNALSSWIAKAGRRRDTPKAVKVASEGLLPFRKTPANVLIRAEEYSPLGLVNAAVDGIKRIRGLNGKTNFADADITGADVVNALAKSLTGTGVFLAGMALRNAGFLRGGDDDDEKQAAFDDLTGRQAYSLELPNGASFTMDWLTPAAMPLFMGAQLMDEITDGGFELKDLEKSLTSIAEPMLQMSMLQGVDDVFNDLKYSEDNLGQLVVSLGLNYLTQGLTNSLVGQLERTSEEARQSTYIDRNSPVPSWLQSEIGRASAKIPGIDFQQIPYIDAWGRTEESGDVLARSVNNLFNPAYVSQVDVDKVEKELQRIKDSTGATSVFPQRAAKYFNVNGERKDLTAEEYVKYAKALGNTRYQLAQQAMQTKAYREMDDAGKADFISKMYELASAKAAKQVAGGYQYSDEMQRYMDAEKEGITPVEFYAYKEATGGLEADKDANGKSITGSKKEKVTAAIAELDGFSPTEKDWLYLLSYDGKNAKKDLRKAPWNK